MPGIESYAGSDFGSDRWRVANISCTFRNVTQQSVDSIARQWNESIVISEKIHLREASGAKSPSRTISSLICRAMKGRTQPLAGPIQVDLQASILGSSNRSVAPCSPTFSLPARSDRFGAIQTS